VQGTLRRIRALGVPPAWTEVWICPDASGHIQATGRDARGRKQYRYQDDWREVRGQNKFERIVEFAHLLPGKRARVQNDMSKRGAPREKVWRQLSVCSTRPSYVSATASMPRRTGPTA
jgi:DNA topoisomerase-1